MTKVMLLLTEGLESGSDRTLDVAIVAAQNANAVVFPIGLPDPQHHKLNRRGLTKKHIQERPAELQIAKATGGTTFLD
jgi:hypothetical protein